MDSAARVVVVVVRRHVWMVAMNTAGQLTVEAFGPYVEADVVASHDLQGVSELLKMADCDAPPLAWLAMALVLRSSRDGHTCVDLSRIEMWRGAIDSRDPQAPLWPTDTDEWLAALRQVPALVSDQSNIDDHPRRPFIIDGHRLYSARVLHQEMSVAQMLSGDRELNVRVILGGPGSGKTTLVARELVALLADDDTPLVALAAPTGKAARRMVQVLESTLVSADAPESIIAAVRESASLTVHKLLEYNPNKPKRVSRDRGRPLERDVVIIDEASMMSLDSMNKLLDAMPIGSTLWLVGDPDQLASVDAGTVLADIASGRNIQSSITRLTGQHRFSATSTIGQLVEQVRRGDPEAVMDILRSGGQDVTWVDPASDEISLRQLKSDVVEHARRTCEIAAAGDVNEAVRHNLSLQVLSGARRGPLGVADWNASVQAGLGAQVTGRWYVGRPVLVTQNDSATKLSNGDVGVVIAGPDGGRQVAFGESGTVRTVSPTRLPRIEDVHALTIHKSQGSEYDHAVVVLPDSRSQILTRELLYTGISRPRQRLTLVATEQAIRAAVGTPVRRATGLADRL